MLNVVAYTKLILFPFLHFIFKFFLITAVLFLIFLPPLFSRTSNIDILSSLFCTSVWYYFIDIMRVPQFLHLFYLFCFLFYFYTSWIQPYLSPCPLASPTALETFPGRKPNIFFKKIKNQWKQTNKNWKEKQLLHLLNGIINSPIWLFPDDQYNAYTTAYVTDFSFSLDCDNI